MENQPTKTLPWKNILRWIIGIFCALLIVGAFMELFMYFSLGVKPAIETMIMGAIAGIVLWKLRLITHRK